MAKFFDLRDDFEGIISNQLKEVVNVEKIPTGWTNYVFVATAKKGKYIFRFPRNDFFSEALEKEIAFNKYIKGKVCVKTPNLKLRVHDNRIFSMHKMIDGNVLASVYKDMTLDQKKTLGKDIAGYLVGLQSVKLWGTRLKPLSEFLTGLAKVNDDNYDYDILMPLTDMESELLLSHGDFNPGNLILDDNYRLIAVLDYAFVSFSCKENDLSRIIGRLPNEFYNIIIEAYEDKAKSKVDRANIDKLINIWHYVEDDYISYMKKCHPDVVLPAL